MAKSKETFSKKEKEKKKLKKQQDKQERKDARKANSSKGTSFEDMLAYVDENGNLTSTPPDLTKKKVSISADSIQISTPKQSDVTSENVRTGNVTFFNKTKGFGFIKDVKTLESIFVHENDLIDPIKDNDRVTFDVKNTPKGLAAIDVRILK